MSLTFQENASLAELNTLGISASVGYLVKINDPADIGEAVNFAANKNLPLFPLGGGSNIVLGQDELHCVAAKIEITGREVLATTPDYTEVRVGAGENWDELVAWSVEQKLSGIESLSLIPGTVGAAPVQNIGAYGQELNQTLVSLEAFDAQQHKLVTLSNQDCQFSYRDSMLKHAGKGRYVVTSITLRLVPEAKAPRPTYASLLSELDRQGISSPNAADIRDAVIAIRRAKLPDPATTPTAGSFFHNPIIDADAFERVKQQAPDIPHWQADGGKVKLAAGWLVEQCGFKGRLEDGVGMYDKQALALINPGHQPAAKVLAFAEQVKAAVRERFGVELHMEPELIRF